MLTEAAAPKRSLPSGVRDTLRSVRFRTTAVATVAVLTVLVLASVWLVGLQRRTLVENLDEALRTQLADVTALATAGGLEPELSVAGDDISVRVTDSDGVVLAASPDPAPSDRGDPLRAISQSVKTPNGPVLVTVVGDLGDVEESTSALRRALAVTIPLLAAVLAALVWWLVGRTLRPVEEIRKKVEEIGGTHLDRRVPEPVTADEVGRLARTMNQMLGRIEAATEQQRRFVADAAHELRSPLARLRSELEVDMAHPGTADAGQTLQSLHEEVVGLQRLVEDLLLLARSDVGADAQAATWEAVDLDDIVTEEAMRIRSAGVTVDTSGVSAAQVRGDGLQLARAVRNLAENAARHAESRVAFELGELDGHAVLAVSDDGEGIPDEMRETVFGRFTRLDDARSSDSGGAGLGLAITREIVRHHGGDVAVDPESEAGARFVLRIPALS